MSLKKHKNANPDQLDQQDFEMVDQHLSELHLLRLPPKILDQILENLDTDTLLSLCLVNSQLYGTISNKFLYNHVVLRGKLSLLKFNALIHAEFHTADALQKRRTDFKSHNTRFLVKSVEFVDPQCQDSLLKYSKFYQNEVSMIGGTYSFLNDKPKSSNTHSTTSGAPLSRVSTNSSASSAPFIGEDSTSISERRRSRRRSHSSHTKASPIRNAASPLRNFFDSAPSSSLSPTPLLKMETKYSHYTYIELMLDIIDYLPNLSHVILSQVEPGFKVPLWYSVLNDGSREFFKKIIKGQQSMNREDLRIFKLSPEWISDYEEKFYSLRRFKKLEIRGCDGVPPVVLRPNLLCCFGVFDALELRNLVIDSKSLDTPFEYLPLHMRKGSERFLDVYLPITSLTLNSCEIVPGNGIMKLIHFYFNRVRNLTFLNLQSKYDLLLSNCFPCLTDLTIDCNSTCFVDCKLANDEYYHPQEEIHDDNESIGETLINAPLSREIIVPPPTTPVVIALNSKYIGRQNAEIKKKPAVITCSQQEYYHSFRIPQFHYFFHHFKDIWDRVPCQNIHIKIVNIPFTNVYPLVPHAFWEQLLNYQSDDQETLCGSSNAQNESYQNTPHWWDSLVDDCMKNSLDNSRAQPLISQDSDLPTHIDSQITNNYQNSKVFRDIPNVNVWYFLKNLSKFKSVQIGMSRTWLFCTPRTRYDWELLLKPVLSGGVPVQVRDNNGYILYSYDFERRTHGELQNK